MGRWWVFYEDWQMECCGTPFSVGEEVSWPLLLMDADEVLGGDWCDELSRMTGPVELVRDEYEGVIMTLRAHDGLTAALNGDPVDEPDTVPEQGIRTAGLLTVERHSGEWPETTGRVRAIHLVHQEFAESVPGSRTFEPVPGSRSLRAVDSCPKWFGPGPCGALAELEVPDPRT
ncbi:DUF6578 domain-containing protein [Streptomyces sp. NBC_00203]|uniref:DUF6578 domain-containing protein n=1 Tax=Streptomyces sp. NBC_00203 TaxID=2975680 RepID=UPI0032516844